MKYYSKEHQWVEVNGADGIIGITRYAADELNKLSYVELPEVGKALAQNDPLCVVESVKAASDVFMPVSGCITEVNETLETSPETINESPEGDGWICKVSGIQKEELALLMTQEQYLAFLKETK